MIDLRPHQRTAVDALKNGAVLVGGTGSGKSITGLAYFYEKVVGGSISDSITPTKRVDLYIITTPKKRDELDWMREALRFNISTDPTISVAGIRMIVDSWNNIKKYTDVTRSFFIFDEQRAIAYGTWSKAMIKIAKKNQWIMLTATPADRWIDLMPVFIANGYYKNASDFKWKHVEYMPYSTYPKIKTYHNVDVLEKIKESVFVIMPYKKTVRTNIIDIAVEYDAEAVAELKKTEWNPFKNRPIRNNPEYRYLLRRIINSHPSRADAIAKTFDIAKKLIVFYNFDFELDILKSRLDPKLISEYNGHKHEALPIGKEWLYLVQYTSGYEAWECFSTNHMALYSLNYSYRVTVQSMGRINRLTSQFDDLYYYRLVSDSPTDKGIIKAIQQKKNFNDRSFKIY